MFQYSIYVSVIYFIIFIFQQIVLAFNEYSPVVSGDFAITLPKWILEIGKDNQDIFFTDSEGRRNTECLSWGIDKERVLQGRTGIEVCINFSFIICTDHIILMNHINR